MRYTHWSSILLRAFIIPIPTQQQLNNWLITRLANHYHPQHCYSINTSTADISGHCSGHHSDCKMEDHQKTSGCSREKNLLQNYLV